MEPATNHCRTLSRVKWQWKSNSDPWSDKEEPQWTSYSPEHNYLIEKAYHENKKEVEIEEYIVSLHDLIQNKKGNIICQRPIRRINTEEVEEEMDIRSERYFETELPKSMNKVFGSLQDFIRFFSRRNKEILDLTNKFQEFEQSNDLNGLNKIIRPKLVCCLEKELPKPMKEDDSLTKFQKKIKLEAERRSEELISLFKRDFLSFEEFYGSILKSYTMNTALYMNLNKHLRNENWIAIENLLSYAVCLCKAFFSFKPNISLTEERKTESSMILYRGTAFDEFALSSYLIEKSPKLFSWNSLTSTSTNRRVGEKFMYESSDIENNKYPVLFIIKIPLEDEPIESEYLKWMDIHQYSGIPGENEVILPPGSAFELEKVETDEDKRTTIHLKLKLDVKSLAHEGQIMQGVLQTEMMSDRQSRIVCLRGEELFEALRNLTGNHLIEEIELSLCTLDQKSLQELLEILPTMTNLKALRLLSCQYENEEGIPSMKLKEAKSCNILEIEISEIQGFYKIFDNLKDGSEYWASLRTLNIDFKDLEVNYFEFQGLEKLSQLTSLTLGFADNKKITNPGMNRLACQGLKNLTQLTYLNLNFSHCGKVKEGLKDLAEEGLRPLTKLTSLNLNLSSCSKVLNQGVKDLALHGLKHLPQLTSLTINLSCCKQITDEGILHLASQGLKSLTQLTSLDLNFSYCDKVKNKGIENLSSQGLRYLTQLNSLSLNLSHCRQITDQGVHNLASQGLKYLTRLASLTVDFSFCERVSDKEIASLTDLTNLTFLIFNRKVVKSNCDSHQIQDKKEENSPKHLYLKFIRRKVQNNLISPLNNGQALADNPTINIFHPLTNPLTKNKNEPDSVNTIFKTFSEACYKTDLTYNAPKEFKALENLTKLTCLTLNFLCAPITEKRISDFASKDLRNLTQLTSLTLDFSSCQDMTDKKLENLASKGLKSLSNLTFLTLKCFGSQITEKGVSDLTTQGLKYLTQLTSLTLSFFVCGQITNKALEILASQGLKNLTKLTTLDLDFSSCYGISDQGMNSLVSQGLKNLTQLTSLTLNFSLCDKITNQGMGSLASQGLKSLSKLNSFDLDFERCVKITEKGINSLISQMRDLTQLSILKLDFFDCEIPRSAIANVIRVLHYFGFMLEKMTPHPSES